MKKILSILGAIGLTATSTTSLTSCQKPNNNENGGGNKPKPKPEKPQQPPKDSNWKLVVENNLKNEFKQENNKWYILIYKKQIILKEKYNQKDKITISKFDNYEILKFGKRILQHFFNKPLEWSIYRWDGVDEPETPTINSNGEITDWKG